VGPLMRDPDDIIPLKIVQKFGKWFPNETAGFNRRQADIIVERGLAEYVKPEDAPPDPRHKDMPETVDLVEIPEGWEGEHHAKIIALAKKIVGESAPANLNKEQAVTIIADELARRAEGEDNAQD